MKNIYLLPNFTRIQLEGKYAFIIGNDKKENTSIEEVNYFVKFANEKGFVAKSLAENPKENCDRVLKANDINGVWLLPYYTKVSVNGVSGFIMENDEDNSEEDLSDLNYLIKFGEDLEEVLNEVQSNHIAWYDDSFLHYEVVAI